MLELAVLAGTLAVAGWAAGAQVHRRIAASRAFDRYSQSRGLVFVPPPPHVGGASPRVVGSKDGVGYVVELFRLDGEVRTRVSATASRGRTPVLSVLQCGVFQTEKEPVLFLGDDAFDRAYIVNAGDPQDVDALRDASPALLVLHERCRGLWLASDGNKVAMSWRGMESDPVVIDAARDVVVGIAAVRSAETPYR